MRHSQHLAIFAPSLQGGGAERVMVMVANGLARRGHKVDLVLVRATGPYLAEVSDDVNLVDLNSSRAIASFFSLVRYLRREKPDAMLSVLGYLNLIAILSRIVSRTKTRVVISERNSLTRSATNWRACLGDCLQRVLYPQASKIIAVSEGIVAQLVKKLGLPPEQVVAIPNPVDAGHLERLSRERTPHPWFDDKCPPVILAVGRLEVQKDYPTLLAAFAKLRRKRPARLIILGDGSLRHKLERTIADAGLSECVLLPGFQLNPFTWMSAASLYVLSSRHEGFPNSLLQAMACGTSVVSTDCPTGPSEILEDGKWGRLIPVGDIDALVDAMAASLDNPHPPKGVDSRLKEFEPESIISRYERAMQ